MLSRSFYRMACATALVISGFALARAEADTRARGQVFTRELSAGRTEVMFSWDSHEKVPFSMRREGDRIVLHFEQPVTLRWGSALKAVKPTISQVESRDGGNTVVLTLSRPVKARYLYHVGRDEAENDENGIDLLPSAGERLQPAATLIPPSSHPVSPHARKTAMRPHPRQAAKVQAAKAQPAPVPPAVEAAQAQKMAALAPAAGAPAPPAPPSAPAQPAKVVAEPAREIAPAKASIPLPFGKDEPFAVFSVHNTLWIAADHFTPPSADALRNAGAPFVKDARVIPDPHATILALTLEGDASATVESTGPQGLRLVLAAGPPRLSRTLMPILGTAAAGGAALLVPAGKSAEILSFRDPATGNMLSVIPSGEAGAGIATPRSFVEFTLLPSAQGIAVQGLTDSLSVSLQKGMVEVSAAGGLAISAEAAQRFKDMESEALLSRIPPTLFPYARWKLDDEKNYTAEQIKLYHDIAFGTPASANKARLKLLGLFLAEGLFPESLGMADDILRSSLKFYRENKVSALRGAAYLFMYRIHEAQRDFSAPELRGDPEAAFWLALCNELLGQGNEKFDFSANYDRYISHYPPGFIGKLAIMAADRNINRKEYDDANAIFETLKRDNFDEPVKKYIDYMRGKIFSETHSESEAVKIWEEQARDLSDPLIRARAEFSLVNMLLKNNKIPYDEAIKRLEKLRIVWRGDSLELGVLTLLGNLYLEDKQYANALRTMRDIVMYYPQVPEAVATARKMEETFVTLYNKDGASSMPPLEALSLFYEFRDLVPLGEAGDQMIRNLADRLVSIDLLDRAAMLLDHQIKNRLQGVGRSQVGAHLAEVYLLNHQPEKALETLKTTGYGNLPADLETQRLRLTSRALAQQGKVARAIDVISGDNSPEGTLLRLSIYWDNKDWANVVVMAEDILGNRTDPSAPLTLQESEVLLKLATAYVYEHDTGQLQYLRDYFTPLMKSNANRDSFLFITSESGAVDYDNLAGLDQDINAMKSFLSKPEDKPGKNGLSKAAN